MPKVVRSAGLRRCVLQDRQRSAHGRCHRPHRLGSRQAEIYQRGAGEVERRESVEIAGQTDRVGHRRRHDAADQIAHDVAGHVGRERACRILGARLFGQIGHGQRKRGRHAQPLRDAQRHEPADIRRARQQGCRDRQQHQTDPDAAAAIETAAQQRDDDAGDRHADGAGIHRDAHHRRRRSVGATSSGRIAWAANRSTSVRKLIRPTTSSLRRHDVTCFRRDSCPATADRPRSGPSDAWCCSSTNAQSVRIPPSRRRRYARSARSSCCGIR